MDYLLAILNATLCVHATEHNIHRVTQKEFDKNQCYPMDISCLVFSSIGWMDKWIFANNTKFRKLSICITD